MEVIMDILSEALNGANKTRIMYRANLNFVRFNRYLAELLSKGLIEEVKSNPEGFVVYRTTAAGRAFLRVLREAQGYMSV
jgi:predicted transcriptional regulator